MNFPSSPTIGDTYTYNGLIYVWGGAHWESHVRKSFIKGGADPYVEKTGDTINGGLVINNAPPAPGKNPYYLGVERSGEGSLDPFVATSATTDESDPDNTVMTKGYIDERSLALAVELHTIDQKLSGEVTEDIVMYLDASNPISYRTGTDDGVSLGANVWCDLSGNGHHATVVDSDGIGLNGKFLWPKDDDNGQSHIILPHAAAQSITNNEWTLEFVMQPYSNGTDGHYFGSMAKADQFELMLLMVKNDKLGSYGGSNQIPFTENEVTHFAITSGSGDEGTLYKDGVNEGISNRIRDISQVADGGWILNQDQDAVGGNFQGHQNYRGAMYVVKLYNRILSGEEIEKNSQVLLEKFG